MTKRTSPDHYTIIISLCRSVSSCINLHLNYNSRIHFSSRFISIVIILFLFRTKAWIPTAYIEQQTLP